MLTNDIYIFAINACSEISTIKSKGVSIIFFLSGIRLIFDPIGLAETPLNKKITGEVFRLQSVHVYFTFSFCLNSTRLILPEVVLGNSSINSMARGYL